MGLRGIGSYPLSERHEQQAAQPFSAEAVELFLELERSPNGNQPYSEASWRLAEMLGLTNEWWASYHVNDRSRRPSHPPGFVGYDAFWKCLAFRNALLRVCAQRDEPTEPPTAA
jgi:hypothetical protein